MSSNQLPAPEILHLVHGTIACESIKKEDSALGIWVRVPAITTKVVFHWKATADSTSGGADVSINIAATPGSNAQVFLEPYSGLLAPVRRGELKLSYSYTDADGNEVHSPVTRVHIDLNLPNGQLCQFS